MARNVFQKAQGPDNRRRVDALTETLVVEADVAADHRRTEKLAGRGHALDTLLELVVDLRPLRIAEV